LRRVSRQDVSPVDLNQSGACRSSINCRQKRPDRKEQAMLDVILLAVGLGFFALSVAYVFGCDRL